MDDVRLLAKGRITDLSKGFHLRDYLPFSIYLRSKTGVVENDTIVQCRLICDKSVGDFPVPVGDWTPGKIVELPQTLSTPPNMRFIGAQVITPIKS